MHSKLQILALEESITKVYGTKIDYFKAQLVSIHYCIMISYKNFQDNSAKLLSKHVNLKMDSSYVWYGANFFHLKRFVSYVPDDDALKPIINEILERFKNFVHPILRNLRQSRWLIMHKRKYKWVGHVFPKCTISFSSSEP